MPIKVNWDDETGRQIIHFQQVGIWSWEEYDAGVDKSMRLMDSVQHLVTILINLEAAKSNSKNSAAFRHFMDAMKRWQANPNYAQFWVVLKPNYWEQITLWVVAQVYNPYHMVVAKSLEDARQKALHCLTTAPYSAIEEIPD